MKKILFFLFVSIIVPVLCFSISTYDYSGDEYGGRRFPLLTPTATPIPSEGYCALENNMQDSSGNGRNGSAVGSGPTYATTSPLPVRDVYYAKLAANDAISIPTSVFDSMANTGTIKACFFVHPEIEITTAMVVFGDFGVNGELYTSFNGNRVYVSIPTADGDEEFNSGTAVLDWAKWYELYITYASKTIKVYLKDLTADSAALIIDETLAAATADFSGCTEVLVGNYGPDKANWNYAGGIDHVGYYDRVLTDDGRSNIPQFGVLHIGHSTVKGTTPALGCREEAYSYFMGSNMYYNFHGDISNGNGIMERNSGVNSDTTALIDDRVDGVLDDIYPQTGSNQIVWLGPMVANDTQLAVNTATTKANIESILDKIDTHSSDIKIFMITDNDKTTVPTNIEDYNAVVLEVYNEQLAAGKNVYYMDLYAENVPLVDGVHPTVEGYAQMGEYLASKTNSLLQTILY